MPALRKVLEFFGKPRRWLEGLRRLAARKLMPTALSTEELRGLGGDIKRWSVFSAKVENAKGLQAIQDTVAEVIRGVGPEDIAARARGERALKMSVPEARFKLQQTFRSLGITVSDKGKVGTIEDPQSEQRAQLIVSTQESLARNYGHFIGGQDRDILDVWPCQELVRISPALEPRDWPARWLKAGGHTYEGRMIALKNSDVWERLGDSGLFPDALGNPYPPYAFNSGMGVEDVSRDDAEELGVIAPHTPAPLPQERSLLEDVRAGTAGFDESIRDALAASPDMELAGDVLRLKGDS